MKFDNAVLVLFIRKIGQRKQVLLAKHHSKAKFGPNKWNGYGGHIEDGETPTQASVREAKEEAGEGLVFSESALKAKGVISFYKHNMEPMCKVRIYLCEDFAGEAVPTEEMLEPTWFDIDKMPVSEMLPGDKIFMPKILSGKTIHNGWLIFEENFSGVRGYGGFD